MTPVVSFHSRLKSLRLEKSLNQASVSKGTRICRSQICEMECNRSIPNMWHLMEFAKFFGVSVDYLVGLTDKREAA